MISDLETALAGIVPAGNIIKNEDMSRHTTFRIGGPADYFVRTDKRNELIGVLDALRSLGAQYGQDYCIIGNGSNLLVSDKGYRGAVISLSGELSQATLTDDTHIWAGAGALNASVANLARDNSLTGFEFAHGIPGTIGGALIMNAGAYDGEMSQVVRSVEYIDKDGSVKTCTGEEAHFGYRTSAFKGSGRVLIGTLLELAKGDKTAIDSRMKELMDRRRAKQPLEYPSAGSTFKRPEGNYAGRLIEEAGLRGYAIGGARVSEKHCGFVINSGDATASDVDALIRHIQARVLESSGTELEPEIIRLGEF